MKDIWSIIKADCLQYHLGVDDIWRKLMGGFTLLGPIIFYEPILRAFLRKLFATLLEDGVRWAELRSLFLSSLTLRGQEVPILGNMKLASIFNEEITAFISSREGRDFWGGEDNLDCYERTKDVQYN